MKRTILFAAVLLAAQALYAQTCIEDVWQCLRTNQVPKARKFVEECLANNPDNAQVWLMRANVYIQLYERDQEKAGKDPDYTPRFPDAIMTANECFVKSLELDPTVKPKTGMIAPRYGQQLCAEPLFKLGIREMERKDYDKAAGYFNVAARNFELGNDTVSKSNVTACYIQLALAYQNKGDNVNYILSLKKAANTNTDNASVYNLLYDSYKTADDTAACREILEKATKNVPAEKQNDLISTLLDFYAYTNQTGRLDSLCDTVVAAHPGDFTLIGNCANYLSNAGSYGKAEEILNNALAKEPKNFELNKQMGYRYFMEAVDYENKQEEASKAKEWAKMGELRNAAKEIIRKAHDWCQQAYEIDGENKQNNIMLQQLKVKLLLPVSDELKAKVDSYRIN